MKLAIHQLVYFPILTDGHELWMVIQRIRPWIQVAPMRFLRTLAGFMLHDRKRSAILEDLRVQFTTPVLRKVSWDGFGTLWRCTPRSILQGDDKASLTGNKPLKTDPGHTGGSISLNLTVNVWGFHRMRRRLLLGLGSLSYLLTRSGWKKWMHTATFASKWVIVGPLPFLCKTVQSI